MKCTLVYIKWKRIYYYYYNLTLVSFPRNLFYMSSTHWVHLGFVLGIGVILIYERPHGHIVNYKINLSCLENFKNTSKIKSAWWAVKSAYMNNHAHPSSKPKYKKKLSSIWIIHSIISHAKKESTEGWKGKYEEEKDKECLSVWVFLHSSDTTKYG